MLSVHKLLRVRTFVVGVKMKFGPRKKGVGLSEQLNIEINGKFI